MLSVVTLNFIMLNVLIFMLGVIILSVIMLNDVVPSESPFKSFGLTTIESEKERERELTKVTQIFQNVS
jgi:hypothetical protein